ncbi:hypothetical protein PENTCL1PPCAC_21984, partial [Pristionchus entomophagus]
RLAVFQTVSLLSRALFVAKYISVTIPRTLQIFIACGIGIFSVAIGVASFDVALLGRSLVEPAFLEAGHDREFVDCLAVFQT